MLSWSFRWEEEDAQTIIRTCPAILWLFLLKHATLMITHGGLNSVMEALAEGVPLVVLPACSDQPGVATRVIACGAGEFIAMKRCQSDNLRPAVERVLSDPRYKARASLMQDAIGNTGGIEEAADVIERVGSVGRSASGISTNLRHR